MCLQSALLVLLCGRLASKSERPYCTEDSVGYACRARMKHKSINQHNSLAYGTRLEMRMLWKCVFAGTFREPESLVMLLETREGADDRQASRLSASLLPTS